MLHKTLFNKIFGKICPHCAAINKHNYGLFNKGWNDYSTTVEYGWGWYCRECGKIQWEEDSNTIQQINITSTT